MESFKDYNRMLEEGLKKIGFNQKEIQGILGNNWFNFYKDYII